MPVILQGGHIYQGTNRTLPKIWSGGKAAKLGFHSQDWDWSNLSFDGSKASFSFVPDPEDGGLQGDFSIGTGSGTSKYPNTQDTYNYNNVLYEIDPAGGTGSFSILSRDLSYWHKYGPLLLSYQYTKQDNELTFSECKFSITNSTNFNSVSTLDLLSNTTKSGQREYKVVNAVKINTTDDTKNTNYVPNSSSSTDLAINFKIGPNNTPEASYTDVIFVGFINEFNQNEYFSSTYQPRNIPWTKISESKRCLPNKTQPKEFTLLRLWQKPNILYYVHMKFINLQYTNYDSPPGNGNVLEHWNVGWNVNKEEILLYIEFGVSPNGGKTIWWNGVESDSNIGGTTGQKLVNRGITSIVPNDINQYLTASLLNYSFKPNSSFDGDSTTNRYKISTANATVYGSKAFKYVRIPITTDTNNDEANNIPRDRWQRYRCINFEDIPTNTTASNADDSNIGSDKKRNGDYWAKYPQSSQSAVKFQVGRKYKTANWKTDIHVDLFYKKDSLKYIGSTDGKTVVSKL